MSESAHPPWFVQDDHRITQIHTLCIACPPVLAKRWTRFPELPLLCMDCGNHSFQCNCSSQHAFAGLAHRHPQCDNDVTME